MMDTMLIYCLCLASNGVGLWLFAEYLDAISPNKTVTGFSSIPSITASSEPNNPSPAGNDSGVGSVMNTQLLGILSTNAPSTLILVSLVPMSAAIKFLPILNLSPFKQFILATAIKIPVALLSYFRQGLIVKEKALVIEDYFK